MGCNLWSTDFCQCKAVCLLNHLHLFGEGEWTGREVERPLPLILLLIHLEYLLCSLYLSRSWSQGPFGTLWMGSVGDCQSRNCSAAHAEHLPVAFWSCGVACCLEHPVPLTPCQGGTLSPAQRGDCCPLGTAGAGGLERLCSSPQPSSPVPPSPRWGALSKRAGKGMVLRVGICPPWSCKCVIQELDSFSSTVRGAQHC